MDLSTFDGCLLDGLEFCRKVYDLFDKVSGGSDRRKRLLLRPTKVEKRLLEELIPLARYLQTQYREGRRIRVRWSSGSQPFDGLMWSTGSLVRNGFAPRKAFAEVTTSVHDNDYLVRQELYYERGSFGPKLASRDEETGRIVSEPYVYHNDERATDLADQIIKRIRIKSKKNYPPRTVLIVNCISDGLLLDADWDKVVKAVLKSQVHLAFQEVFLVELSGSYTTLLRGGNTLPNADIHKRASRRVNGSVVVKQPT